MREMIISELTQALHDLTRGFAHYLPRLIVMLILAFVGWLIAYVVKVILRSILRLIKFDRLSENAGASQLLAKAALPSATEMLSRFVFWVTWFGFILLGVSVLGILGLQEQIARFFLFLPRLFVAVLILFFGMLAASFSDLVWLHSAWGERAGNPGPAGANREIFPVPAAFVRGGADPIFRHACRELFRSRCSAGCSECECSVSSPSEPCRPQHYYGFCIVCGL